LLFHINIPIILLISASGYGHYRPDIQAHPYVAASLDNARLESMLNIAVREGLPGVSLRVKGPVLTSWVRLAWRI
jgi:hypothetical protein